MNSIERADKLIEGTMEAGGRMKLKEKVGQALRPRR
jgi:hypothetical protein